MRRATSSGVPSPSTVTSTPCDAYHPSSGRASRSWTASRRAMVGARSSSRRISVPSQSAQRGSDESAESAAGRSHTEHTRRCSSRSNTTRGSTARLMATWTAGAPINERELAGLVDVAREAVEDEPGPHRRPGQVRGDDVEREPVGDELTGVEVSRDGTAERRVAHDGGAEQGTGRDVVDAEAHGESCALGALARPLAPQHDDPCRGVAVGVESPGGLHAAARAGPGRTRWGFPFAGAPAPRALSARRRVGARDQSPGSRVLVHAPWPSRGRQEHVRRGRRPSTASCSRPTRGGRSRAGCPGRRTRRAGTGAVPARGARGRARRPDPGPRGSHG